MSATARMHVEGDDDCIRLACTGTDREWFEATGNCGHCGMPNPVENCACTKADPCGCGPHDPPKEVLPELTEPLW